MKKILCVLFSTILICTNVFAYDYGDVDCDGQITANDAAHTLKKAANFAYEPPIYSKDSVNAFKIIDADADGQITANDSAYILKKARNFDFLLPSESNTQESTTETTTESDYENKYNLASIPETFSETKTVSNYSDLISAISSFESKTGDYAIYISDDILCSKQIKLSTDNYNKRTINIIGIKKDNGKYPIIDFQQFRDSFSKIPGSSGTGIYISGSGYNFKNIFVQNAPDCGIRIKGSGAGHCIFEDMVIRYNNNSGISVTAGGEYNTFKRIDSYRNCDLVQKLAGDADGFSAKLAFGKGNVFYNCRAWDNGDDGWDSYENTSLSSYSDVTYYECVTRHNGSTDIYTGQYDYKMGYPLDKNLLYIQVALSSDPDFETKYNNRQLDIDNWPSYTIKKFGNTATFKNGVWSASAVNSWGGNPNGFKFGSAYVTSKAQRLVRNCIAIEHEEKGFDQNNGAATIDMENTLAFGNGKDYAMAKMTATNFKNIISFTAGELPQSSTGSELSLIIPSKSEQTTLKEKVISKFENEILNKVRNDEIPKEVIFDVF